jgi:hypothetical protein
MRRSIAATASASVNVARLIHASLRSDGLGS